MKKDLTWLEENVKKVSNELNKRTGTIDDILNDMNYTEEEQKVLRLAFI